jgi:hypothetical protein
MEYAVQRILLPLSSALRTFRGQAALAGFMLVAFLAIGSLTWPLGNDQAIFTYIGQAILDGGVPYQDGWDLKAPLTHYMYALSSALFGRGELAIRITDLALIVLFSWGLRSLVLRLANPGTAGANFAVILFLLCYFAGGYWETAQPDEWGGMLVLVAVSLLLGQRWNPHWTMAAAGSVIAVAALLKPTFLLFLAVPVLQPVFPPGSRKAAPWSILWCLTGCAITLTAAMMLFAAVSGGLQDFLDILYFLSSSYAPLQSRNMLQEVATLPGALVNLGLLVPYLLAPFGLWMLGRHRPVRNSRILTVWFAIALLAIILQGKYWPYTFLPATIAVCVILGAALSVLLQRASPRAGVLLTTASIAVAVLALLAPWSRYFLAGTLRWPAYVSGLESKDEYLLGITGSSHYSDLDRIAAAISSHSNESERILLWGWEARVLLISRRKSASRFEIFQPVVTEGPLLHKYRSIYLSEINRNPPRFVVVDTGTAFYRPGTTNLQLLAGFPELAAILRNRYRLVDRIKEFQLLEIESPLQ